MMVRAGQGSVLLQEQACWVLLYVAAASVATSESMAQKGAIGAVVATMRLHPAVEGVQVRVALLSRDMLCGCLLPLHDAMVTVAGASLMGAGQLGE